MIEKKEMLEHILNKVVGPVLEVPGICMGLIGAFDLVQSQITNSSILYGFSHEHPTLLYDLVLVGAGAFLTHRARQISYSTDIIRLDPIGLDDVLLEEDMGYGLREVEGIFNTIKSKYLFSPNRELTSYEIELLSQGIINLTNLEVLSNQSEILVPEKSFLRVRDLNDEILSYLASTKNSGVKVVPGMTLD